MLLERSRDNGAQASFCEALMRTRIVIHCNNIKLSRRYDCHYVLMVIAAENARYICANSLSEGSLHQKSQLAATLHLSPRWLCSQVQNAFGQIKAKLTERDSVYTTVNKVI